MDQQYLAVLTDGAEAEADRILAWTTGEIAALPHRETMRAIKALVAVSISTASGRFRDPALLLGAEPLLAHLEGMQLPDGLFDSENLQSPPDTCFTITDLCLTLDLARAAPHPMLDPLVARLEAIAAAAVDALVTGGVHTPNHRWELAAALVHLDALASSEASPPSSVLRPDDRLVARAEQWLAEGIDAYADGHYSERSANYSAYVTNPSLITLGTLLDRPGYLDLVRANLDATLDLLEDDLTVETVHSRRQDQHEIWDGRPFLSQFRRFAVLDSDGRFARVVRAVLERGVVAPAEHLAEALAHPALLAALPDSVPVPPGSRRVFPSSGLARVRDGAASVSVFGGGDHARFRRIASGLANSSTIVRLRHGAAVVEAVRLSPQFFGLGPFRADGLAVAADGAYELAEERSAGYYQPLPADARRASGEYELGSEGRFFGSMSFPERPSTQLALSTRIAVTVDPSSAAAPGTDVLLDVAFDGVETSWAFEIVLRPGGVLSGAEERPDGTYELVSGTASYRVGDDVVEIGPGNGSGPRQPAVFDPGELVDYVGGTDAVPGLRLYITGRTDAPFRLTLRGRSA